MAFASVFDSTATNPGGTGSTITVALPTHAVGDIIYISIGNTGNTLWTGNPTGWNRVQQVQVGTATNGLVGTFFWRKIVSGDTLPLANPVFALGATVTREAFARTVRGSDLEGPFTLPEWSARAYNTGTANPVRPGTITTPAPEGLILLDYFQRSSTNAPDQSGYTQDEEIIISGTLVGNATEKTVADQRTTLTNQDASPTSGVRWVAGIACIPSPDYVYYRAGTAALTASGTSATPNLPTGTSSSDNRGNKDLIVATIEVAGTPTISPNTPADWTEIAGWATTTSGNGSTIKKYWTLYDGTVDRQFNRSTTGEIYVYLSTYRNTRQTNPIGSTATQQNASSTSSAWPSMARSATKATIQATCIADGVPTYTAPATWVERNDGNGTTCADQSFDAVGTVSSASFTLSTASPTAAGLLEIESVSSAGELQRTATVDGAGAISTSATFLSVESRSALVNVSGEVISAGARVVSRSVSVDVSASVESAGTVSSPSTTFERSCSVDASSVIASAASFFSIVESNSVISGAADIASAATFFSTLERASLLTVTAGVDAAGAFFTTLERAVVIDAAGGIQSSGTFFSLLERSTAISISASIESNANFFTTLAASALVECSAAIEGDGLIDTGAATHERSAALDSVVSVSVSGSFFSILERTGACNAFVNITTVGQKGLLRTSMINALGLIVVSGGEPTIEFHPKGRGRVGRENRTQAIGAENRTL